MDKNTQHNPKTNKRWKRWCESGSMCRLSWLCKIATHAHKLCMKSIVSHKWNAVNQLFALLISQQAKSHDIRYRRKDLHTYNTLIHFRLSSRRGSTVSNINRWICRQITNEYWNWRMIVCGIIKRGKERDGGKATEREEKWTERHKDDLQY